MSKTTIVMVIASVLMSAVAQLLLKSGMSVPATQRAISDTDILKMALAIFSNAAVLAGLAVYFGSALVWLSVLSRVEVSVAYPFVALGFVITALLGHLMFGEALNMQRIVGILLICGGVAVLARS